MGKISAPRKNTTDLFIKMRSEHATYLKQARSTAKKERDRRYYLAHREQLLKKSKRRYQERREEINAYNREYYRAHREKWKEYYWRKELERARDTKSDTGGIGIHSGDILAS